MNKHFFLVEIHVQDAVADRREKKLFSLPPEVSIRVVWLTVS